MPTCSLGDETYVTDLCDELLGCPALRRHRFAFLRGETAPEVPW